MTMRAMTSEKDPTERARWMAALGRADPVRLEAAWAELEPPPHRWLRRAETGLVMVRGRAGGTGQPFNLGEMTMTRAAVVVEGEPRLIGFGYVAGRAARHAELAALFDALLQDDLRRPDLLARLIAPLEEDAGAALLVRSAA